MFLRGPLFSTTEKAHGGNKTRLTHSFYKTIGIDIKVYLGPPLVEFEKQTFNEQENHNAPWRGSYHGYSNFG